MAWKSCSRDIAPIFGRRMMRHAFLIGLAHMKHLRGHMRRQRHCSWCCKYLLDPLDFSLQPKLSWKGLVFMKASGTTCHSKWESICLGRCKGALEISTNPYHHMHDNSLPASFMGLSHTGNGGLALHPPRHQRHRDKCGSITSCLQAIERMSAYRRVKRKPKHHS